MSGSNTSDGNDTRDAEILRLTQALSMSNVSSGGLSISPPATFTGDNYDFWEVQIRNHLRLHRCWYLVENGFQEKTIEELLTVGQRKEYEAERDRDMRALIFISQAVNMEVLRSIATSKTSKEAWDTLKNQYEGSPMVKTVKLQLLRRNFENFKMRDKETAKEAKERFMGLVLQLRHLGETITEDRQVEIYEEQYGMGKLDVEEFAFKGSERFRQPLNPFRQQTGSEFGQSNMQLDKPPRYNASERRDANRRIKYQECRYYRKNNHKEADCFWHDDAFCDFCKQKGHVERVCNNRWSKNQNQSISYAPGNLHNNQNNYVNAQNTNYNHETMSQTSYLPYHITNSQINTQMLPPSQVVQPLQYLPSQYTLSLPGSNQTHPLFHTGQLPLVTQNQT